MSLSAQPLLIVASLLVATPLSFGCDGGFEQRPPCDNIDCAGHGVCIDDEDSALCLCEPGWESTGEDCILEGGDGDADADTDGDADADTDADGDADADGCSPACPESLEHATSSCIEGVCTFACDRRWADCDVRDGCESSLASPQNCGACDAQCAGTTPYCEEDGDEWRCVNICEAPMTLCGESCVNTDVNPAHCGGCHMDCTSFEHASCASGECSY